MLYVKSSVLVWKMFLVFGGPLYVHDTINNITNWLTILKYDQEHKTNPPKQRAEMAAWDIFSFIVTAATSALCEGGQKRICWKIEDQTTQHGFHCVFPLKDF